MREGYMVLETGEVFVGQLVGEACGSGEVVFNTSMMGYQEIIDDPSYAGQILVFSYPLVRFEETGNSHLSGIVVMEMVGEQDIPVLTGVDTRELIRTIRKYGSVKGVITDSLDREIEFRERDLLEEVSCKKVISYEGTGSHIVIVDYGYRQAILADLAECRVTIVPYNVTFEAVKSLEPDGIVFSSGPGNPLALEPWFEEIKKISSSYPSLGVGLGHQAIALAYGGRIEKISGHRGSNYPVKDMETGRVRISEQNHGYGVTAPGVFNVSWVNVNDGSIEGLKHRYLPLETFQFNPEGHDFRLFLKRVEYVCSASA